MAIEVVFEKRINNAAVQRDVDTDRQREYVLLVFLAALFVLGLLFYGWQQYRWRQLGYELESAQRKKDELVEYRSQLQAEHASQSNPNRIDRIARNELGMIAPGPGQRVVLSPDAPLTIPGADDPNTPALTARK